MITEQRRSRKQFQIRSYLSNLSIFMTLKFPAFGFLQFIKVDIVTIIKDKLYSNQIVNFILS